MDQNGFKEANIGEGVVCVCGWDMWVGGMGRVRDWCLKNIPQTPKIKNKMQKETSAKKTIKKNKQTKTPKQNKLTKQLIFFLK